MADDVRILPPTGKGTVEVRTVEIDGIHYPMYLLASGADGTEVSGTNPLSVVPNETMQTRQLQETMDAILERMTLMCNYLALMTNDTDPPEEHT